MVLYCVTNRFLYGYFGLLTASVKYMNWAAFSEAVLAVLLDPDNGDMHCL